MPEIIHSLGNCPTFFLEGLRSHTIICLAHLVKDELLDDARAGLDGVAQVEEDEGGLDRPAPEELAADLANSALTLHGDASIDTNTIPAAS